jgi:hypothetical protein
MRYYYAEQNENGYHCTRTNARGQLISAGKLYRFYRRSDRDEFIVNNRSAWVLDADVAQKRFKTGVLVAADWDDANIGAIARDVFVRAQDA